MIGFTQEMIDVLKSITEIETVGRKGKCHTRKQKAVQIRYVLQQTQHDLSLNAAIASTALLNVHHQQLFVIISQNYKQH